MKYKVITHRLSDEFQNALNGLAESGWIMKEAGRLGSNGPDKSWWAILEKDGAE